MMMMRWSDRDGAVVRGRRLGNLEGMVEPTRGKTWKVRCRISSGHINYSIQVADPNNRNLKSTVNTNTRGNSY
jgi:hypothetical protein